MTTKEYLLDQFTTCYDENGWFVALKNTLNNLSGRMGLGNRTAWIILFGGFWRI